MSSTVKPVTPPSNRGGGTYTCCGATRPTSKGSASAQNRTDLQHFVGCTQSSPAKRGKAMAALGMV